MDWLRERPIAHRGLHSDRVPENSLPAFQNAVDAGYPAELDVRVTADGVPVVFHDRKLDRLTDKTGAISDNHWADIADCTLKGTNETVPRLEAVLDTIDGQVPLLIELKNFHTPGKLERSVVDCLDSYEGDFAIQSFNPLVVWWLRRHRTDWPRGQLAPLSLGSGFLTRKILTHLVPSAYTRPDFVGYGCNFLPSPPFNRSKKRGRDVLAWTVRSEDTFHKIKPHVDNVIFEAIRP
ncbi:glycerophosphodiester phosphodiesterase family protein [Halovenus rubra]|uniref:Glycerophosphodiester phosphodiesterase family protein n=2 Tax=Halovenus rubra TaxID=869890 RepID=A0ABD5X3R4_9EURY|nr:glycerophosphodiester phosphodiesterase family protein [Halovenus rubra]